jgi:Transposase DDE domain
MVGAHPIGADFRKKVTDQEEKRANMAAICYSEENVALLYLEGTMSGSQKHPTALPPQEQLESLLNRQWESEILPQLPPEVEEAARRLQAFQRVRQVASATDLLRALLVYALYRLPWRQLGAWAVLVGLGNLCERAWRKRLARAAAWITWLLGELIGSAQRPSWLPETVTSHIYLVDASWLRVVGGTSDDLRLHLGYDLLAGRMQQVWVTDHHCAESVPGELAQPGTIVVGDCGYRKACVLTVLRNGSDGIFRRCPLQLRLEEEQGAVIDLRAKVKGVDYGQSVNVQGWISQGADQPRYQVRVVLYHLPQAQAQEARRKKQARGKAKGKQPREETLWWAEWVVLLTTLPAQLWPDDLVLLLYRARWQIELIFKRMKTFLELHCLRIKHLERAREVVQLLLIGWWLHEQEAQQLREVLDGLLHQQAEAGLEPSADERVWSSWTLSALSIAQLRRQLWGGWTAQRWQQCAPLLLRFCGSRPRPRGHQETDIRATLLKESSPLWSLACKLAA